MVCYNDNSLLVWRSWATQWVLMVMCSFPPWPKRLMYTVHVSWVGLSFWFSSLIRDVNLGFSDLAALAQFRKVTSTWYPPGVFSVSFGACDFCPHQRSRKEDRPKTCHAGKNGYIDFLALRLTVYNCVNAR